MPRSSSSSVSTVLHLGRESLVWRRCSQAPLQRRARVRARARVRRPSPSARGSSVDYKSFLKQAGETVVLPYFGGTRVDDAKRRLHVEGELAPGWWQFQIDGRRAVAKQPASPVELSTLPAVRGHWVSGWVVVDGKQLARIALPPDDEPAPLSRITARRWYSNDLLFDTTEFEDDAELAARTALEERRPLGDVKGVVPSLRAAFAYALGMTVAHELA